MTRRKHGSRPAPPGTGSGRVATRRATAWMLGLAGILALTALLWTRSGRKSPPIDPHPTAQPVPYQPRARGTITFSNPVAALLHQRCAPCHRPGEVGPFALLTYADARERAKSIARVTRERLMPPWLPDNPSGTFQDERRLSVDEIGLLQQWVEEGLAEGDPTQTPPPPSWPRGWQLGTPDLIAALAAPYLAPAEGRDVYRNLVLPLTNDVRRYVIGVEFRPGGRGVHHAALRLDRTRYSRRLDARDAEPGFGGMALPETTEVPNGHFLNWQPGKQPYRVSPELAWTLEPGTDLVIQLHVQPGGKPEPVQPLVGFYFSDRPPSRHAFKVILDHPVIDIPPGAGHYVIHDPYVLPVDAAALMVFPHAHYLAREMTGRAVLPDGTVRTLLHIPEWNFNWQGDYRFVQPIELPKGTRLEMEFSYDNSTNNTRNPSSPPRRVRFGPQTTDEMGELWVQLLPRREEDFAPLAADYARHEVRKAVELYSERIRIDPAEPRARVQLGTALLALERYAEAGEQFREAARLKPDDDQAQYYLAVTLRRAGRVAEAQAGFERALQLNPDLYKAHGNLGAIALTAGDFASARLHFEAALAINPADPMALSALQRLEQGR